MAILYTKHGTLLRYLAMIILCATCHPGFSQASSPVQTAEETKKAILDDPVFLSHLRDRLSVESLDADGMRTVIRNYLLENPEIIFEMQEALNTKNTAQATQDEKKTGRDHSKFAQYAVPFS